MAPTAASSRPRAEGGSHGAGGGRKPPQRTPVGGAIAVLRCLALPSSPRLVFCVTAALAAAVAVGVSTPQARAQAAAPFALGVDARDRGWIRLGVTGAP